MPAVLLAGLPGYAEQRAGILAMARAALDGDGLLPTAREIADRLGLHEGKAVRLTTHLAKSGALGLARVTVPNGQGNCRSTRCRVVTVDASAPPLVSAARSARGAQEAWVLNALLAVVRMAHSKKSPLPSIDVMARATGMPLSTVGVRMLALRKGRWFGLKKDAGPNRRKGIFVTWVKDGAA